MNGANSFGICSLTMSYSCVGVSGAKLAIETCRAGGLGFLAAGHLNSKEALHQLEREIEIFEELSDGKYPLCIGFIGHSTFGSELGWNLFENVLEDYQPVRTLSTILVTAFTYFAN
jgi:hypothetical protein